MKTPHAARPPPAARISRWAGVLLVIILASGAHYTLWTVQWTEREMRIDLLAQAQRITQGISVDCIRPLTASASDLELPEYQRLKQQLSLIKQACPEYRFVYLLGRKADGTAFFYADSEVPGSEGYSRPGQVYDEAGTTDSATAAALGSGEPVVVGPVQDRWGSWVSAAVPLLEPRGREIGAVLGVDIDARVWKQDLFRAALRPLLLTLTMALLLLVSAALLIRRQRLAEAAPRWLGRLETALAVTVGLTLTFFVAWRARERELRNNHRSFALLADHETRRLTDLLQDVETEQLLGLARFVESDRRTTAAEFQHFAEPLTRNPAVRAWEWLPAVPAADRAQTEREARGDGQPGFAIWERDAQGQRVPAAEREVYYPVLHVTPLAGNAPALGFDAGSEPVRRAALLEAARTGLAAATDPINLVQNARQRNGMAVFQPVLQAGEPATLRGFAVAVLQMDAVMLGARDRASLHLTLSLLHPGQPNELLASTCTAAPDGVAALAVSRPVAAFGRVFLVAAYPHPAFLSGQSRSSAAIAVLRGLGLTAALTLLVGAPVRRREELERLVGERTSQLRREEERLAATLRSIADGVIESDAAGRVVGLNPAAERLTGWTTTAAQGRPLTEVFRSTQPAVRPADESPVERARRASVFVDPSDTATLVSMDGSERHIASASAPICSADGETTGTVLVCHDVTREHHAQQLAQVRLALLEYAPTHTLEELMRRALDEICALLESPLGFYHAVDADQKTLTLQQWSTRTLSESCEAKAKARHGDLDQAGAWADCVRERRTVVHHDYASLPQRHGLPAGHPRLVRELVTPVLRDNCVVAILGVGNKPADYSAEDVETIGYLADLTWQMVERKQAAEALRESNARYDQLALQSRTFTWEVDATGLYTYVSPAVTQVLGYRPDEMVGKLHYYDLHPEAGRAEFRAAAQAVFARHERFTGLENPAVTRAGGALWLSTVGIPKLSDDGGLLGYRGSDTDITARRQTEQNYEALFREMLDGFALHEIICDAEGKPVDYRFLAVNPAFERMTGLRAEEVLGRTARELFPSLERVWIDTYGKVALTGQGSRFEQRSQGLDMIFEVAAYSPAPRQFACIVADITERRRLEAERERVLAAGEQARRALLSVLDDEKRLAAERARLAAGIEQAGEAVLITDPTGNIQYANPAFEAVTGYRRDEVLGRNPRFLKSGRHDAAFYREMWETIASGRVWKGRFVNRRKDGALYTADATISPVRDAAGGIGSYVAVKRDVTEHLLVTEQLQQAQKMDSVGLLAGGVAHDFNNLLMGIMNYVDLCRDGLAADHPIRAYLDEITAESQRSANLTRQLLAFARKQMIMPQVLDLNDVVTSMLNLLRRLIGENIELAWLPGAPLWPVKMDPSQIDQILANLCVNARDAIEGAGTVTVRTANITLDQGYCEHHRGALPGDYVRLMVSDTGCGMASDVLEHIFEPFFTTKGMGKGTGLGLATVYGIVMQNAGAINVASEPGKGTTFRVYLPRAPQADVAPKSVARPVAVRPRGTETILLVEDERSLLVTTRIFLEDLGYSVLPAASPAAAMALAEQHAATIHLLLTDVVMPGMSGKDLATRLAATRPEMPCLYMSGYTADAIAHMGILEVGVRFLPKPFSRDSLALKVRQTLDAREPT